ncbi:MAG TPA: SOS response-associated peptidase family protein [Rhizomicrobium sp.]|jgi:putative SOS response-associated peptidase YedK|nr:SOS response-associated peptidase family protein [Rhizomicrobium sp.]
MCGKFTQSVSQAQSWQEHHDLMALLGRPADGPVNTPRPMHFAQVLRLDNTGKRQLVPMRWGFAALSAKNPGTPDHIHARAETIDIKPTFREAFRARRGVMVMNSFNEGEEITPSKTLQYVVTPRDNKTFAVAVLWEAWENPEHGELLTYVMATVPANALIAKITDRMPAIFALEDIPAWLGETTATIEQLKAMLRTVEDVWEMAQEKKTAPPKKPSAQQELF